MDSRFERPHSTFAPSAQIARQLRREQTQAEYHLWQRLRNLQLGVKFRRQHPRATYVVDFCCLRRNLIVELDGAQHGECEAMIRDARRDEHLRQLGFAVLRFTNEQALTETEAVVEVIRRWISPGAT